jgi:predicted Zn-ribbon and HTH transcriptional regulator
MWFLRLLTGDSEGREKCKVAKKSKRKNRQETSLKLVPLVCADCGYDLGRSSADQIFLLREKVYCRGCKANYLHAKSLEDLTVNVLETK